MRISSQPKTGKKSQVGSPERGVFFKKKPGRLVLADGAVFTGFSRQEQMGDHPGEIVFSTGMTGYVESLTDPSYAGQILVFTYPLIGNYGVPSSQFWESDKIQVSGVIFSELAAGPSHSDIHSPLINWLISQNIPFLTGVDTRALTKYLRSRGTSPGVITDKLSGRIKTPALSTVFRSIDKPRVYKPEWRKTLIVVDCGIKKNILRFLLNYPIRIKRVPYDYDYSDEDYAGILISNGPGDPADYKETIRVAKKAMGKGKPIFGICLGSQILGLAAGAKTYKLPYGHRGHNQPCIMADNKCYITSQNHGYAVKEKTLPKGWQVTFRNLNDGSVEGLRHKTKPFFAVQFHPEASPGPTDTNWLFEEFYEKL